MSKKKMSKKRNIDQSTPIADIYPLGDGRYVLNARNGIAPTLTGRTTMPEILRTHDRAFVKWEY